MGGRKVLRNQSKKILSSSWILHKLQHHLHSWIWSVMWVAVLWQQDNRISTPSSYLIGSWKYCRNMKDRELKSGYLTCGSSMYHLVVALVRVHWNNLSLMESSMMLLDEHHRWNVIIWFWGHSLALPSNFEMSNGSLVGMGGQKACWKMGTFVHLANSGKFNWAMNGKFDPKLMWDGAAMGVGFTGA